MTATDARRITPERTVGVEVPVPPARPVAAAASAPHLPDWRNLLAPTDLDDVAVVGPLTEVTRCGRRPGPDGSRAATVVLASDRRATVTKGLSLVRPGGILRVDRASRRRRALLVRRLRRAGFGVELWWHRPSIDAARCLVRLDDRVAAGTVVGTVADRGRWRRAEVLLAATGLARVASAQVSLIARAPGGDDRGTPLAQPEAGDRLDGLVTPRFAASRAVIGISTADGGRRLARVAKVARRRGDDHLVEAEGERLQDLIRRCGAFPGAPTGARLERRAGRTVLVEDAVPGTPLDRRAVRRDPIAAVIAGRRWLQTLPVGPPTRPADDGRAAELLVGPVDRAAGRPGPRAGHRVALAHRAEALLVPLASAPLPSVFEHGDLSHPNLLRTGDGALHVVDWEAARPTGMPLHDLLYLLAYVVESVEGPEALATSLERAVGPHGWARPELDLYAERLDLDRRLLRLLAVSSWTRRVAALPEAATSGPRAHRTELLWEAAIDAAEGHR